MKSFLQGKRTLDMAALRAPRAGVSGSGCSAGSAEGTAAITGLAPQIDVVKQGDKIVRIVVTCTCGEQTEIECLYPPGL